ncbi:MAG: ribosome maturation factor RimM [bacterium]
MELIKVGRITTAFGIKGELKVKSESDCIKKNFKHSLYIKLNDELIELKIEGIKGTDDKRIVKFDKFNSLTEVENIKNVDIYVEEVNLPKLSKDEFYIKDVIGLPCYVDDKFISNVEDVREYPQGFYLVLIVEEKTKLIPFINEFTELTGDKIIIKPIEGLL